MRGLLPREARELSGPRLWPVGRNLFVTTTTSAIADNNYKRFFFSCFLAITPASPKALGHLWKRRRGDHVLTLRSPPHRGLKKPWVGLDTSQDPLTCLPGRREVLSRFENFSQPSTLLICLHYEEGFPSQNMPAPGTPERSL